MSRETRFDAKVSPLGSAIPAEPSFRLVKVSSSVAVTVAPAALPNAATTPARRLASGMATVWPAAPAAHASASAQAATAIRERAWCFKEEVTEAGKDGFCR